jgi:GH25 family lysozyme M1 (1,4-beta-N-acetylmuramidase)
VCRLYDDRVDFNDGSQYRVVTDPAKHRAAREIYCFRAASARSGVPYVDTAFAQHRSSLAPMRALVMYQFVYTNAGTPEAQADFFLNALGGGLHTNEMVMIDPESGGGFTNSNVVDFTQRWLNRVEKALDTRAWVYVPSALSTGLSRAFTKDRIVVAPRYSGTAARGAAPWWPHDIHQYTDQGPFPGCAQSGDTNYTTLTVEDLLRRCNPNGIPVPPPHGGI